MIQFIMNKRNLSLSIIILGITLLPLQVRSQEDTIAGTKMEYKIKQLQYSQPPEGYHAIFINHVGRHASRFMTKAGSDIYLSCILHQAEKERGLSSKGFALMKAADFISKLQTDVYGDITKKGEKEQQVIGHDMKKYHSEVFSSRGIEVYYTHKKRTLQSAENLLRGMDYNSRKSFIRQPKEEESLLRFFDFSPAFSQYLKSAALTKKIDSLKSAIHYHALCKQITEKLLTPSMISKWSIKHFDIQKDGKTYQFSPEKLAEALYDLYASMGSMSEEMEEAGNTTLLQTVSQLLSTSEKEKFTRIENAKQFFYKGPGTNRNGIQVKIAAPLLWNFLSSTDSILNGKASYDAILRFTHVEGIAPFATLCGLYDSGNQCSNVMNIDHCWHPDHFLPMASNIQWIIYQNQEKKVLIKFLMNETETSIPLKTTTYPYYPWEEVKSYYLKKLAEIGYLPNSNEMEYLKTVY